MSRSNVRFLVVKEKRSGERGFSQCEQHGMKYGFGEVKEEIREEASW